jgi:Tol biopolymer transport system component
MALACGSSVGPYEAVSRLGAGGMGEVYPSPVWSPDGGRIVFRARRGTNWALVEKRADGAGEETSLAEFPYPVSPMSWSPDGTHLLFMLFDPMTNWDIWQYSFAAGRASRSRSEIAAASVCAQSRGVSPGGMNALNCSANRVA